MDLRVPENWEASSVNGRQVFCGPEGQVLTVSVAGIAGRGETAEIDVVRRRLIANAESALREAASDPELVVVEDLKRIFGDESRECQTIRAVTRDGSTLFQGIIAADRRAVLMGTFEAPNTEESRSIFR